MTTKDLTAWFVVLFLFQSGGGHIYCSVGGVGGLLPVCAQGLIFFMIHLYHTEVGGQRSKNMVTYSTYTLHSNMFLKIIYGNK